MNLWLRWLVPVALACATPAFPQTAPLQPGGGKVSLATPKVEDSTQTVFVVPSTHLTFRYMPELKMEDPKTLGQHSYRVIFALHPDKDPNHIGADPCSPVLLAAGVDNQSAQSIAGSEDFHATPPTGGMILIDVDRSCLGGKSDEEARWQLLDQTTYIEGLTPVSKGVSYKLDGHPAGLMIVQGFSKNREGKRVASAGMTLVGGVTLSYEGHLLFWSFIANDPELFNRMLRCRVQFDGQPSWPLVPFALAENKH